jgi:hypothetical protein
MAALVAGHICLATVGARSQMRRAANDPHRWMAAASQFVPPALVRLAVAEYAVLHIALFRWRSAPDVPEDARAFSYHRHLTPMCATLLALSAIEVATYHLLLAHWSKAAMIAMFVLSDLGFVYLVGLIKSFRLRPILMTPAGLRIRAGLLIDEFVSLDAIAAIETGFGGADVKDAGTLNTALLAWPNIMLRLNTPVERSSLLGGRRTFGRVAFRLDEPEPFLRLLAWRLGHAAR